MLTLFRIRQNAVSGMWEIEYPADVKTGKTSKIFAKCFATGFESVSAAAAYRFDLVSELENIMAGRGGDLASVKPARSSH